MNHREMALQLYRSFKRTMRAWPSEAENARIGKLRTVLEARAARELRRPLATASERQAALTLGAREIAALQDLSRGLVEAQHPLDAQTSRIRGSLPPEQAYRLLDQDTQAEFSKITLFEVLVHQLGTLFGVRRGTGASTPPSR